MKIAIPKEIREKIINITNVWIDLKVDKEDEKGAVNLTDIKSIKVHKEHINIHDWYDIVDEDWIRCTELNFRVLYIDQTEQKFCFNKKNNARYGYSDAKIKIGIPERIKNYVSKIAKTSLLVNNTEVLDIPITTICNSNYVVISLIKYTEAKDITFKVLFNNGNSDTIIFANNKKDAIYKSKGNVDSLKCLKKNIDSPFSDDNEGRDACLARLEERLQETSIVCDSTVGEKTLIYYTVYFNTGYVELFNLSLKSILNNCTPNFDVLVITDKETQKYIKKTECAKLISLNYFITDTPVDGVEASKNKISIFNYSEISNYNKILFLDCDIIAINNFDSLFNKYIESDILYSVKNANLNVSHFKTIHHGFTSISQEFVEEMRCADQQPFNAGQFLFKNSERMKKHFENLLWFMNNWPSEYFFEQCFMCYYFASAYMVDINILAKYIGINSTKDSVAPTEDIKNKSLIHFISPPLDAACKLNYINNFLAEQSN